MKFLYIIFYLRTKRCENGWLQLFPVRNRCQIKTNFSEQLFKAVKSKEARPTLRSVAQAIRTGIFIEKIYQRMSKTQMMAIPEEVGAHLEVSQEISDDVTADKI